MTHGVTKSSAAAYRMMILRKFPSTGTSIRPFKSKFGGPIITNVGTITSFSKLLSLWNSCNKQCGKPKFIYTNRPCKVSNKCYGVCFRWGGLWCKPKTCKSPYCMGCGDKGYCYGKARCTWICRRGVFKFPFFPALPFNICKCCSPSSMRCSVRPWLM